MALEGFWEGLRGFWEASKRHLGPKTVRARIFGRFLKKTGILGLHLGDVLTSKFFFFLASKRVSKIRLIFKAFCHRFWGNFRGSGNAKNEVFVWKGCIFD